jgi:methylated-DNA-protein-cysteine methyltransferase-like protein
LPLPSPIPWHRVVNAQGRVAMCLSREGSDWMQRQMLIAEGIPVDDAGRLPLKRFLWTPEPQAIRGALGLEPDQSDPLPRPCSLPTHRMAESHG